MIELCFSSPRRRELCFPSSARREFCFSSAACRELCFLSSEILSRATFRPDAASRAFVRPRTASCARVRNGLSCAFLSTGRRYVSIRYLFIFLPAQSDDIKSIIKNKEKYGKIENNFFRRWIWISIRSKPVF